MLDTYLVRLPLKKTNIMKKLNLDDFKEMANNVQTEEAMSKIEGGLENSLTDCHGFWGPVGKALRDLAVTLIGNIH